MRRLRILMTEGSSLSARQTLYMLGAARHIIDVCDPHPWRCLARWSRFVRRVYRCPPFADDPAGYLRFLHERLTTHRYDVLLPVHDQAYLLARCRERLGRLAGLAVPEFAAIVRLQSKAGMVRLFDELGLPHPPTRIVRTRSEAEQAIELPCYLKLAHATAGRGVWRVGNRAELEACLSRLERNGVLDGRTELLVQQPAEGTLSVVQSVFHQGRLLAAHCYQARAQGVGGSAWARVSVDHPEVREQVARLGRHLRWHGALMLDYLYDPHRGPSYIDANPRLGETFNAFASGLNLCELLLRVSMGEPVEAAPPSKHGVRTHSLMMSLLGHVQAGGRQGRLLAEACQALIRWGLYADSQDELTRPWDDWPSAIPAGAVVLALLAAPRWAGRRLVADTVASYALTEAAARIIQQTPCEELLALAAPG
ncbi:MAG: hypothetical protein NZ700_08960 [Gemmataceae bacterium]|nr:hypothetical protein [Gemmataceae bacterium]MDW8267391.1 hypothetical protein [Gemmataceae bacterium]